MHVYDKRSGIIFYSQVSLNGIGCWNTEKPLNEENFHLIAQDNTTMIYPSDINVRNKIKNETSSHNCSTTKLVN